MHYYQLNAERKYGRRIQYDRIHRKRKSTAGKCKEIT